MSLSIILTPLAHGDLTAAQADQIISKFIAQNQANLKNRHSLDQKIDMSADFLLTGKGEATAVRHELASGQVTYDSFQMVSGSSVLMKKVFSELSQGDQALNAGRMQAIAAGTDLPGALIRDNYSFSYTGMSTDANGNVFYKFHVTPIATPKDSVDLLVNEDLTIDGQAFQPVRDTGNKVQVPAGATSVTFDRISTVVGGVSVTQTLDGKTNTVVAGAAANTHFVYTTVSGQPELITRK